MATSFIFDQFGTFLLSTLIVASLALSKSDVISDMVHGSRSVLLFARLSDRFILIISGIGKDTNPVDANLEDALVFEQNLTTMQRGYLLLKEPQKLRDRWPLLYSNGPIKRMFVVPDSSGVNIVLLLKGTSSSSQCGFKAFNVHSNQLKTMSFNLPCDQSPPVFLSSDKQMTFYHLSGAVFEWHQLGGSTLDQDKQIPDNTTDYRICKSDQTIGLELITACNAKDAGQHVDWQISSGFSTENGVLLLIDRNNSVLSFSKATFTSGLVSPVVRIPAIQFWRSWQLHQSVTPSINLTSPWPPELTIPHSLAWLFVVIAIAIITIQCGFGLFLAFHIFDHFFDIWKPEQQEQQEQPKDGKQEAIGQQGDQTQVLKL